MRFQIMFLLILYANFFSQQKDAPELYMKSQNIISEQETNYKLFQIGTTYTFDWYNYNNGLFICSRCDLESVVTTIGNMGGNARGWTYDFTLFAGQNDHPIIGHGIYVLFNLDQPNKMFYLDLRDDRLQSFESFDGFYDDSPDAIITNDGQNTFDRIDDIFFWQ